MQDIKLDPKIEKEFDKLFTRSDGLIDKYSWYGVKGEPHPQPTPKAIKQFLVEKLAQQELKLLEKIGKEALKSLNKETKKAYRQGKSDTLKEVREGTIKMAQEVKLKNINTIDPPRFIN